MKTYNRLPVNFEHGEGSYLYDTEGKKYLDAISGIAVCALGHSHPVFIRAVQDQVARLVHTSNVYGIPLQARLAKNLSHASGMDKAFFCNSGAEANEAAIKLARMFGHNKGIDVPTIIVTEGGFHGRTMGALTATHSNRHQDGFSPFLEGFVRVPYNDVEAVKTAVADNPNIVAILLEPVQGETGICVPAQDYLNQLREICDSNDMLLMLDEVQTGNGRTGQYFACQHNNVLPDVISTAKGLGNGFPIGACLASGKAGDIFQPGHHATTFGGSPLACAAALAVNQVIIEEGLVENARNMGSKLLSGFNDLLSSCDHVKDIRGLGLMIGIELDSPCTELVLEALQVGLLINVANSNVVRLVPPLNINDEEADIILETTSRLIKDFGNDN